MWCGKRTVDHNKLLSTGEKFTYFDSRFTWKKPLIKIVQIIRPWRVSHMNIVFATLQVVFKRNETTHNIRNILNILD